MRLSETADESGRRWAWRRWHESCIATVRLSGWRGARGVTPARNSPRSLTRAEKAAARSAQAGSSPSTCPSSFRCEPQPEVFTITVSTPSNASIVRRANVRPSSPRPACIDSAPQQLCGGATTS